MSKVPYIERAYGDMGVTGECAYVWSLFLMHEADWNEDYIAYDKWRAMVEQLTPKAGKAVPASVYCSALEDAIARYTKK